MSEIDKRVDGQAVLIAYIVACFLIMLGALGGWIGNSWYHYQKYSICREYEKFKSKV